MLEKINQPDDIRSLDKRELYELADDLRETLLNKLSIKGGHNGPNLGVVELTIALHYVFDSPKDKIVFDVSHQTYIHKMLTGRSKAFTDQNSFNDVTGYTDPKESEHDFFTIGHTSTSISLANGLAKARDLKGDKENILAVIGDGSLSGGEALEGLNNVGELNSNMIIIVNDNDQSIAENHGGLYKNLKELRETKGMAETNLFTAMGIDYKFIEDGHKIENLIEVLMEVKDRTKPIVLHVYTVKGKGYKPAEENREKFHAGPAIDLEKGEYKVPAPNPNTYQNKTTEFLIEKMKEDKKVALLTAGTPSILGFNKKRREEFKDQFIDVGIAEEHAVAMISGMAKNGAKPVFGVASTFLQRTYDQILHDLSIDSNPATILIYAASISSMTDVTHLSFFDIAMISNIPTIVYLAPTTLEEHIAMLDFAIEQTEYPVAVRMPVQELITTGEKDNTDYSKINKSQIAIRGKNIAIIGVGNMLKLAVDVANEVSKKGIDITIINPKFISGIDKELLEDLKRDHDHVITLEDGIIEGGYGSKIASFYGDSSMKVKNLGIDKKFIDRYNPQDIYEKSGLTKENIVKYIYKINK